MTPFDILEITLITGFAVLMLIVVIGNYHESINTQRRWRK